MEGAAGWVARTERPPGQPAGSVRGSVTMDGVPRPSRDLRPILLAVAAACVAGVLALRLWLKWVGPLPGDRWAQAQVETVRLEQPWRDLGFFFSVIGEPTMAFVTALVAAWFVRRAAGWIAVWFVVIAGLGVFANMLLKVLSGPTALFIEKAGEPHPGLNYPSGHTVYGVVMFGSLAWLAWAHQRRDIAAVLIALVALMGPFRVVADAHFVSDVLAGYLSGVAWLLAAALLTGGGGTAPGPSVWAPRRSPTRATGEHPGAPASSGPSAG